MEWLYDPLWHSASENPLQQRSRFALLRNVTLTGLGLRDHVLLPDDVFEASLSALRQLPPYKVHPREPLEQRVMTYDI